MQPRTAEETGQLPRDPSAENQHADHEDRTHNDGDPGADLVGKLVLERDDEGGAYRGAEHGADAADEGHQHHLARGLPLHVAERGEAENQGLGRAGQARQPGGEHEGEQLVALDLVAEGQRPRLVLAGDGSSWPAAQDRLTYDRRVGSMLLVGPQ